MLKRTVSRGPLLCSTYFRENKRRQPRRREERSDPDQPSTGSHRRLVPYAVWKPQSKLSPTLKAVPTFTFAVCLVPDMGIDCVRSLYMAGSRTDCISLISRPQRKW